MPLLVETPIRLRVDARALSTHVDEVEQAVCEAVTRALGNARSAVEDRRGGYATHRAAEPDFVWGGPGLVDVAREQVDGAERAVRRAIEQAFQDAFGAPATDSDGSLPERLAGAPAETLDRTRFSGLAGLYAVPSYQEGRLEGVPTRSAPAPRPRPRVDSWEAMRFADAALAFARWSAGPMPEQLGVIFRNIQEQQGDDPVGLAMYVQWWHSNSRPYFYRTVPPIGVFPVSYAAATAEAPTQAMQEYVPPVDVSYRVKYLCPGGSTEQITAVLREHNGRRIRELLLADMQSVLSSGEPHEIDQEVDQAVLAYFEKQAEAFAGAQHVVGLFVGDALVPLGYDDEVPIDLDARLIPVPRHPDPARTHDRQFRAQARLVCFSTVDDHNHRGEACSPFRGEPALAALGLHASALEPLLQEIAADLGIEPCPYAARFCLNAVAGVEERTAAVPEDQASARFSSAVVDAGPDWDTVSLDVSESILALRQVAATVPKLTELSRRMQRLYEQLYDPDCPQAGSTGFGGWVLDFLEDFQPALERAVGRLFIRTCQVVLLQLLRASRAHILERLGNDPDRHSEESNRYLRDFATRIREWVLPLEELDQLHDRLAAALDDSVLNAAMRSAYSSWRDASGALDDVLAGRDPREHLAGLVDLGAGAVTGATPLPVDRLLTALPAGYLGLPGRESSQDLVVGPDGVEGIRDRHGHVWTLDELRVQLNFRRRIALLDPLVGQIVDDDDLLARFRRFPDRIEEEATRLLEEMKEKNQQIIREVRSSPEVAFGYARIYKDQQQQTVPHSGVVLQGIHLLAHQQIGGAFAGDDIYGRGLHRLFWTELGEESLLMVVEVVGITALAVFCAPMPIPWVPMALEVGLAQWRRGQAEEREALFRALVNPESVISRSEVEIDLIFSRLEQVLAFLPLGVPALRAGISSARLVARQGVRGALGSVARGARRRLTAAIAIEIRQGFAAHVMKELVEEQIEDQLLDRLVFQPLIAAVQQTYGAAPGTTPTGPAPGAAPSGTVDVPVREVLDVTTEVSATEQPQQDEHTMAVGHVTRLIPPSGPAVEAQEP